MQQSVILLLPSTHQKHRERQRGKERERQSERKVVGEFKAALESLYQGRGIVAPCALQKKRTTSGNMHIILPSDTQINKRRSLALGTLCAEKDSDHTEIVEWTGGAFGRSA